MDHISLLMSIAPCREEEAMRAVQEWAENSPLYIALMAEPFVTDRTTDTVVDKNTHQLNYI